MTTTITTDASGRLLSKTDEEVVAELMAKLQEVYAEIDRQRATSLRLFRAELENPS